jgi:hypothetical protein
MSIVTRLRVRLAGLPARLRLRPARRPTHGVAPHLREGWQLLESPLAGLVFHEGGKAALDLKILEQVALRREPHNPYDSNAVVVATARGRPVGHLPKDLARQVGPALDAGLVEPIGVVTELRSNTAGTAIGVRIAFNIQKEVASGSSTGVEFSCERGEAGTTYLLVNCDGATLDRIQDDLAARGLSCERSGQTFRPSADGHAYQWYVRMGEGVTPEAVIDYFAEVLRTSPWAPASRAVDEYVEGFDKELADKDARIAALEQFLFAEREQTRQAEHSRREAETSAMQRLVSSVLPNVTLLRGCWDVLATEIQEPGYVLRDLVQIAHSQAGVAAATVRGATGWKELHFNTGQRDNGRLYFRRSNGEIEVLVSFKGDQERDIQYLNRQ